MEECARLNLRLGHPNVGWKNDMPTNKMLGMLGWD